MDDNCSIIKATNKEGGGFMKYLRKELRDEHSRISCICPDIEGITNQNFINVSEVLKAYFILADYFTDPSSRDEVENMLVGLRSYDLLASALGRQWVGFGGKVKYERDLDVCATLFFGLVKNHAFSDGNKRTALLVLLYQLNKYGLIPTAEVDEFERLVMSVAASTVMRDYADTWEKYQGEDDTTIKVVSDLLRKMVSKKDNAYHIDMTAKEFCDALSDNDVEYEVSGGKIHFTYIDKSQWEAFRKEKNFSIIFGGWTRTIGAKTARDTLQQLGLYDQVASYQGLLDGDSPMYQLVHQFEVPLRRLKDE